MFSFILRIMNKLNILFNYYSNLILIRILCHRAGPEHYQHARGQAAR